MCEPVVKSGSSRTHVSPVTLRFTDLDQVVDHVHEHFVEWENSRTFDPPLDVASLHQMKLAVHEWLSNLIQHANFESRVPVVTMEFEANDEFVRCGIEDNSQGFDLDGRLSARSEILESFPERGMGLLMIKACTKDMRYERGRGDVNRLEFLVSSEQDPWLNIPF